MGWGVTDTKIHAPVPRVIVPNLVAVGQTVLAFEGVPKISDDSGAPPPWNGGVVTL